MPLQHASDSMLRRMKRGHGGARLRRVVERLRRDVPEVVLRTAFIVGHPGETEQDFEELCDFVRFAEFDRVGVFSYSDEETSASRRLDGKVPAAVAERRARRLMAVQRPISRAKNRGLVGRDLEVLVEGPSEESELVMAGRHSGQAPDIDGVVYLSGEPVRPGCMVTARITKATDYDLLGEVAQTEASESERRAPADPVPMPGPPQGQALVHRSSDGRKVTLKTL
jgi:ribosomal protein S12 methylthiotransferase